MSAPQVVRAIEAVQQTADQITTVRIVEFAHCPPATPPAPQLPRPYNPETDSPLAGRTASPLRWTGELSREERAEIAARVEFGKLPAWRRALRPRPDGWGRS